MKTVKFHYAMKTFTKTSFLFACLLSLGMMPGHAQLSTVRHDLTPFNKVDVDGAFTIVLSQGGEHSVVVEAPDDILGDVSARVSNSTLSLEYKGSSRNLGKTTIYVNAREFNALHGSGATLFRSENSLATPSLELKGSGATVFNLETDTELLRTELSGASSLSLSGRATRHELKASGASLVRAYDLQTQVSQIKLSGASLARIHVETSLTASLEGSSSLSYRGNPLNREIQAAGMSTVKAVDEGSGTAAGDSPDTLIVSIGQREVRVADKGTVSVRRSHAGRFRNNWSGVELGINGYLSPSGSVDLDEGASFMDVRYNRSVGVNLNLFQQNLVLAKNRLALVTGLGLSWNNYYFQDDIRLVREPEGIEYYIDTENSFRRNKLTISHLNVPLLIELQSAKSYGSSAFHLSAGVNVGLRLRSHTKQVYDQGDKKIKDKDFDHYHLNPFRYDLTARLGWGQVNLFASYAMNSLFREGKGPELYPFTVGIRLTSF
jgi:hypothetical protein